MRVMMETCDKTCLAAAFVFLQFCQQRFVVDPEGVGRFRFVAAAGLQHPFNMQAFDLVERLLRLVVRRGCRRRPGEYL